METKTTNEKLISIIVPVYNVEDYLEECVDSILDQSYKNLEIILVDDGSTDESQKICQKYAASDTRVVVYSKENGGLSDARNYGMKKMTGEYFTFVDSDDVLPKNYIEELVSAIEKENVSIAMCDFVRMVDGNIEEGSLQLSGKLSKKEVIEYCFRGVLAHSACAKLFSKEVAEDLYFPLGKYFEDQFAIYDLLLKYDVAVINATKYIYRKRPGSITQNEKIDKQNSDLLESLEHVEEIIKDYPELEDAMEFKILEDSMVIIKKDIKAGRRSETSDYVVKKVKKLSADKLSRFGTGKSFFTQYKLIKYCYPIYRLIFWLLFKTGKNTEA